MLSTYSRTIRFQDTDAAGVVYFANILAICHEAYEASLAASGINIKSFFSNNSEIAIPIVHARVDFFRPLFCGDQVLIELIPAQITDEKFAINYKIETDAVVAKAITKHVCIDTKTRTKKAISADIIQWLHQWDEANATSSQFV
jgi:1,4-dihydroxy-2-naphthoyl-CoA hydrolase